MRQAENCQRRWPNAEAFTPVEDDDDHDPESKLKKSPASEGVVDVCELKVIMALIGCLALCYILLVPKMSEFMAGLYLRTGQPAAALAAYERVLSVRPRLYDVDDALLHAANLLMARQAFWEARHADAHSRLSRLTDALPDRADAHFHLNVEVSTDVFSWDAITLEAREELARADNATALSALGGLVRDFAAEAEPSLQAALALAASPACSIAVDVGRSCHNLGVLLFDLGRHEDAARLLAYPHVAPLPAAGSSPSSSSLGSSLGLTRHRIAHLEEFLPVGAAEFASSFEVANVLSQEACTALIAAAEAHAASHDGWSRGRHQQYPTTDLPLSHLDASTPAVAAALSGLRTGVLPAFGHAYPSLSRLAVYVDDAFVAKYADDTGNAQPGLAFHGDGTPLSFICTLQPPAGGGGTVFRAALPLSEVGRIHRSDSTAGYGSVLPAVVAPRAGDCLIFAGGALLHGGVPVTAGVRYLLIGFVGVGRGAGVGAADAAESETHQRRYDAYREHWVAAKRADAGLHAAHEADQSPGERWVALANESVAAHQ